MEMKKLEEQEKTRIKAQVIILTIFYKVETPTSWKNDEYLIFLIIKFF